MVEVIREIAVHCDATGKLRLSATDLGRLEYAFAASIQLAIGLILKGDAMRQRVEAEPSFMQWALDALYMLSRAWESNAAKVNLDRSAIVQCLLTRSGQKDVDPDPEVAMQMLQKIGFGELDLDIIDRQVGRLVELLCNSEYLRTELRRAGQEELAALVPVNSLLTRSENPREFEFLYDMYGEEVAVSEALKAALAAANLPTALAGRINSPLDILDEFGTAMGETDIEVADLVRLQIFPATTDEMEIERAYERLSEARKNDKPYDRISADLSRVAAIVTFVGQSGARLAALLRLSLRVGADARATKEDALLLLPAVEAVARYVDLRALFQNPQDLGMLNSIRDCPIDLGGAFPSGTLESVRAWRSSFAVFRGEFAEQVPRNKTDLAQLAWPEWQKRIELYLVQGVSTVEPRYDDIVMAAAAMRPGNVFRRDLAQMSLAEWTELCLSGFPGEGSPKVPQWCFVAGLCALGFGQRVIREAASLSRFIDPSFEALAQNAQQSETTGRLLVMRNTGRSFALDALIRPSKHIFLALPSEKLEAYSAALVWLGRSGALSAIIDEEVELAP